MEKCVINKAELALSRLRHHTSQMGPLDKFGPAYAQPGNGGNKDEKPDAKAGVPREGGPAHESNNEEGGESVTLYGNGDFSFVLTNPFGARAMIRGQRGGTEVLVNAGGIRNKISKGTEKLLNTLSLNISSRDLGLRREQISSLNITKETGVFSIEGHACRVRVTSDGDAYLVTEDGDYAISLGKTAFKEESPFSEEKLKIEELRWSFVHADDGAPWDKPGFFSALMDFRKELKERLDFDNNLEDMKKAITETQAFVNKWKSQ